MNTQIIFFPFNFLANQTIANQIKHKHQKKKKKPKKSINSHGTQASSPAQYLIFTIKKFTK